VVRSKNNTSSRSNNRWSGSIRKIRGSEAKDNEVVKVVEEMK